jgi:peptidoglycan hydrolase-like protein with peptidoglycan-binding domain
VFSFRASLTFALTATLIASPAFATRNHRAPTSGHAHVAHKATAKTSAKTSTKSPTRTSARLSKTSKSQKAQKSHQLHGQQAIDPARVTQIQQALIREHYMDGEANGNWDAATLAAMQKFQADQGWQTKLMPDSRALKKLGLGPDYSNAINAKNSSFAAPPAIETIPSDQANGFAVAAGIAH